VREVEVLRLIAAGLSNAAIAERLFLSQSTIKTHIANIFTKLGVTNRAAAARIAADRDLT
jgi:DNA-binding NarL/FixJ family response regulator